MKCSFKLRHSGVLVAAVLLVLGLVGSGHAFPIAVAGTEGLSVIANGGNITATYEGNSAAYSNDLYLVLVGPDQWIFNNHSTPVGATYDLGTFSAGTELVFRLYVNNTGDNFYTGAASRNPDGLAHARVQNDWKPGITLVSFEDLWGTPEGINGYNDLSFSFTNTRASSVPEPATLLLFGAGLAGLKLMRKRMKV